MEGCALKTSEVDLERWTLGQAVMMKQYPLFVLWDKAATYQTLGEDKCLSQWSLFEHNTSQIAMRSLCILDKN